jgi:hypothetical protein
MGAVLAFLVTVFMPHACLLSSREANVIRFFYEFKSLSL